MRTVFSRLLLGALLLALSQVAPAQIRPSVAWQPVLEMGGQLFPSYVLATATANLYDSTSADPRWLGDQNGMLGIRLRNPAAGTSLRLEVDLPRLTEGLSVFEGVLADSGQSYHVFPTMRYNYELLAQLLQPRPATATFTLYLNGQRVGQQSQNLPVRAVTDCPYSFENLLGETEDVSWMLAAYVNENHPDVDVVLGEALATGLVSGIDGYQAGQPDAVYQQVFALWTALRQRGLRYSSATRPSGGEAHVLSQTVRPLGMALRLGQANCVDGTVLLASVLRRIELDPFLVLVPGHCFLGFYLDKAHKQFDLLETTHLADAPNGPLSKKMTRIYSRWFGKNTRFLTSWRVFGGAIDAANATYDRHKKRLEDPANTDLSYQIIDVDECRQTGILPISQPLAEPLAQIFPAAATNRRGGIPGAGERPAELRRGAPAGGERPTAPQNHR